jgi:hypothetical protein
VKSKAAPVESDTAPVVSEDKENAATQEGEVSQGS